MSLPPNLQPSWYCNDKGIVSCNNLLAALQEVPERKRDMDVRNINGWMMDK